MKVGKEILHVNPTPVDEGGAKIEPEERDAVEITTTPIEINLANAATLPGDAPSQGSMAGSIQRESTAGEVAQDVRTRCELCEHWRQDEWTKHLIAIEGTPEGDRQLQALLGELLGNKPVVSINEDDITAAHVSIQREFGICVAFTESTGQPTASPFYGGCPENDVRFKLRDPTSERIASKRYDEVMRLAQGRGE